MVIESSETVDRYLVNRLPAREKVVSFEKTLRILDQNRDLLYVAQTRGAWDLSHPGHLRFIEYLVEKGEIEAKLAGKDLLVVVCVNSDDCVREHKGYRSKNRPIDDENFRAEMMAGIRGVNLACIVNSDSEVASLKPDFFLASEGSDRDWRSRGDILELKRVGVKVEIVPPTFESSTTERIARIKAAE